MTRNAILITILTLATLFLGLIIFSISMMGDRHCQIQLQNQRQQHIVIKTFSFSGDKSKMVIDSVSIAPNEYFKIGSCINCSVIDRTHFDFEAIAIITDNERAKQINRSDLPDYLEKLQRVDCATFVLQ